MSSKKKSGKSKSQDESKEKIEANPNLIDATEAFSGNSSEERSDDFTLDKNSDSKSKIQSALIEEINHQSNSNEEESSNKTHRDSNGETLGQYLSRKREEKGTDLKSIAITTRISHKILVAIENDEKSALPNKTYLRGFVRSFAKHVDADETLAVALMEETFNSTEPKSLSTASSHIADEEINNEEQVFLSKKLEDNFQNLHDLKTSQTPISPKTLGILAIVGLLIFGLGYGVYSIFTTTEKEVNQRIIEEKLAEPIQEEADSETEEESTEITKNSQEAEVQKETTEELKESKEELAKEKTEAAQKTPEEPIAKVKEIETEKQEESKEEVKKEEQETKTEEVVKAKDPDSFWEKKINFIPLPSPLFKLTSEHPSLENDEIFPDSIKAAYRGNSDIEHVYINALNDDTWLSYKSDENPIKSFILKKGRTLLIRGEEIRLFIGRFPAVEVMYNNQKLLSDATGVKSLVFPIESANKYRIPLFIYNPKTNTYYTEEEFLEGRTKYLSELE